MFKDQKIQLALYGFGLFFFVWLVLLVFRIAPTEPFVDFVKVSCGTAFGLLLAFVKPDGGDKDASK